MSDVGQNGYTLAEVVVEKEEEEEEEEDLRLHAVERKRKVKSVPCLIKTPLCGANFIISQ